MSIVKITESYLTAIADAIRGKLGVSTQYRPADMAPAIASIPTGATNYVTGSFKTSSTTGAAETVTIPYTGSGYPIACLIYVKGGAYNNTSSGDTNWYNSVQRYAIGQWAMSKSNQTTTPTYGTSGAANQGVTMSIFKNSTSTATTYSRTSAMNTNTFSSSNATGAAATAVRFKSATQMSVYVASSSYGLLADTEYTYHIIYSA